MWPDRVSNPGPLALESDALLTALRGPAVCACMCMCAYTVMPPVIKFYFEKIITIFFRVHKLLQVRGKRPCLSSG